MADAARTGSTTAIEDPQEGQVLAEQAAALYGNVLATALSTMFMASLFTWAVWRTRQSTGLVVWLVAMVAICTLALWARRRMRRPASPRNAARRLRAFTQSATATGCVWAIGVVAFWPAGDLPAQWLVSLLVVGIVLGAMQSVPAWLPAFRGFSVPLVVAITVVNLAEGSESGLLYALAAASFFVTSWSFAGRLHATMIGTIRARHALARMAADLQQAKEQAEAANLAKSRFLAAASHDLRQPVHALTLLVDALAAQPAGPEADRMLDRISRTVGGLGELFNALLDVSRLDAGVVAVDARPCDLALLVKDLCAQEAPGAAARGLELRVDARPVQVHTDPLLLARILRNLLVNALRYTERGGVLVSVRQRGRQAVLRVVDTGIGIPPERQAQVFEEFVQLHNPERDRHQGLGLGLAIVRRLTRLLGVTLALRSRPGRGSSFTLRLPVATADPDPSELRQSTEAMASAPDGAGVRVLVVDDDADVRAGMRALLVGWGYAVTDAGGLADLLPQLRALQQVPALILSDYRLRGEETGVQVVEQVRFEYNEDIPAILITGETAPERLREAEASGLRVLHKPLRPAELREQLVRALDGAHGVAAASADEA